MGERVWAVMRDAAAGCWLHFAGAAALVSAWRVEEVLPALHRLQEQVGAGLYAAGYIAYEAAPAFDAALCTHPPPEGLPLLCFGLFPSPRRLAALPQAGPGAYHLGPWRADVEEPAFLAQVQRIKRYIARGHTYQVNYTHRLQATFSGDAWALFCALQQAQQGAFGAFFDAGEFALCSASPELFFTLEGGLLTARPMKGTAARGRHLVADEANRRWLHDSEKNRAENVMIVDMIRNDMGRVAETGSVRVPQLFTVERYPTVLQMTSTVQARTHADLGEVLAALFPCASITGAPKVRTMQIIKELEDSPRGAYTGAVGFVAPGDEGRPRAQFNVAIRTVTVERQAGRARYGVGGGIVWDSLPAAEYAECQVKARILTAPPPSFELLESLRWDPGQGYWLLDRHLRRLAEAAAYFVWSLDLAAARAALAAHAACLPARPHKVRLLAGRDGSFTCEAAPILPARERRPLRLALAAAPVDNADPFLYFKTTRRDLYERARAVHLTCDDVLLWNEREELTESSRANLVVAHGGALLTPPLDCGLLAGTFRAELLDRGLLRERVIQRQMLAEAGALYLINSVRGWMRAALEPGTIL